MTATSDAPGETSALARWLVELRLGDVAESARDAAKNCILDSLGCAIAGIHTRPCAMMLDLLDEHSGTGEVSIPGTDRRLPLLKAGYVVAQAANALDFDDSFLGGAPSHPAATIIPPALVLSDKLGSSGADFLRAVIGGYEASLRIGRAIQPTPAREQHVFGFATWQSFGALGVAAAMLGLDHEQLLDAFGLCGLHSTLPGGRKGGFGEAGEVPWLKNNYGGATEAGIWSALLAQKGYRGHRKIFEGDSGFWIMAGSDRYLPERMTEELGQRWLVEQVGFKPYACCRWTHTMIDAIRETLPTLGGRMVDRLTVSGFRELSEMGKGRAASIIDAQFHPRYVAALELIGRSTERGLSEADLDDPEVLALADRIDLLHDPEADEAFYNAAALPVKLTFRTSDGETIEISRDYARGSARAGGFTHQDLEQKFMLLTAPILGRDKATRAIELVKRIETIEMSELVRLLSPGNGPI